MSWVDEICLSCGICCTTLSIVHIKSGDIERLMQGYSLSREQALAMVRRDENGFKILMDRTAACPALSSKAGRYMCHAYEHRPDICREYECYILAFAKDWLKKRSNNEQVDVNNPFHSAPDEHDLARQVQESIQRMRANFLNLCVRHKDDPGFRRPDHIDVLIGALSGAEFENTFPGIGEAPEGALTE